jgi:hypothetical protein
MKAGFIVFVVVIMAAVIVWVRRDSLGNVPLPRVLPGMHGQGLSLHDIGGLVLICMGVWGILRLLRRHRDSEEPSNPAPEEPEQDEPEYDVPDETHEQADAEPENREQNEA